MRRPDGKGILERARRAAMLAVAALALAACGDGTGGDDDDGSETGELVFLRLDDGAPPLVTTTASFWAKRGDNRELRMYHRARLGDTDSTEFLRFEVDNESLLERPDGTRFAEGDSILITVTVIDLANLIVDFQPSGLRFDPDEPAELEFDFEETDDDLDDDGDVDDDDSSREAVLSIWRRESASQPWVRLSSNVRVELDEIEADILGFTNYAIAYRRVQQ